MRSGSYIKQCGITSYQPIAEIDHKPVRDFVAMVNPATTLAPLDENLQLQREKDAIEAVTLALRDNMRQAREQLEAAEKRIAEQREYYEGVIADGSKRIAELEAKLETADRLHDSAFRDGLKAGFSYGQTDDQSGFTQCMSAYNTTPASLLPDGLIRAVHFYEQVKRENPPVETGAWKDAIDWVLKEACLATSTLESSREHEAISQQEKA
ncbi:ead/Ea22-like family protein [Salmonella enterica]|uniref:ead/Ea22-like family protein n=1 Tax=Salmonella enterica TaxID=28901 RepID=UPI0035C02650